MASSSTSNERINGIVIFVNLYLSKTDPALVFGLVFGDVQHGSPIQAYTMHSDKQGLGTDVNLWDRPSWA